VVQLGVNRLAVGAALLTAVAFVAHNAMFYTAWMRDNYHAMQAQIRLKAKDCPGAIASAEKAVHTFGLYWATHTVRTHVNAACEKDLNRLMSVMNEEIAYEPTNARALLTRGYVYSRLGKFDLSRSDYEKVIGLYPRRASAFVGLAQIAMVQGRPAEARSLIEIALINEPTHSVALQLKSSLDATNK
jgi:tetratricopeptide (TPR) repeat protein